MECLSCGREITTTSRFCEYCGARVINDCPSCGAKDIAGKKFCPSCGIHLEFLHLTGALPSDKPDPTKDQIEKISLDEELNIYKRELQKGATVVTCPHCGVKNRVPKKKMNREPICGKCGKTLLTG